MSSKAWLKKCGLKAMRLDLKRYLKSKGASLKPSGTNRALTPKMWTAYIEALERASSRYYRRLEWLLSGTRRVFGTIVEENIVLAVDTSGSMYSSMPELQKQLGFVINDQVRARCKLFNVIQFANQVQAWAAPTVDSDTPSTARNPAPYLIEVMEDTCAAAAAWVQTLSCEGGTNVLEAVRSGLADPEVQAIYLLSDGHPEESTQEVLRQTASMTQDRKVKIHTISYNCEDPDAKDFLRALSNQHGGRYHDFARPPMPTDQPYYGDFSGDEVLDAGGEATGDDIQHIQDEIAEAEQLVAKANSCMRQEEVRMTEMAASAKSSKRAANKTQPWRPGGATNVPSGRGTKAPTRSTKVKSSGAHIKPRTAAPQLATQPNRVQGGRGNAIRSGDDEGLLTQSDDDRDDDLATISEGEPMTQSESEDEGDVDAATIAIGTATSSSDAFSLASATLTKREPAAVTSAVSKTGLRTMYRSENTQNALRLQGRTLERYYPANRAFISNLPTTIVVPVAGNNRTRTLKESDLIDYLRAEGGLEVPANRIDLPFDVSRKVLKGFAYVVFDAEDDLARAIELNGRAFHGRNLAVSVAANPILDMGTRGAAKSKGQAARKHAGRRL